MSKNTSVTGRHRAVPVRTSPLETISKAVSSNAGSMGRQAAVIAAASGLVLTVGVPAQATAIQRDASVQAAAAAPSRIQVEAVQASNAADIEFDRPSISSTPAPVEEPEPVVEAVSEEVAPAEEAPAAEAPAPKTEEKAAKAPKADVAASGIGAALVASAYSQIGVSQDCTAMVENALRSAGISVGDLAPAQFFAYGTQVSTPQPGDMIYYDDAGAGVPHIAIYVGNGQAIHGGWTGYTTTLADAYIGSGPVFIRPSA
ncbi:C40 family peptidase [Arthrobacter sp. Marseille-P9274]|uniref:C40 family peptidase n=1 Tax=Arthrobacter sp. Marseille-P9274 TaxID=2866572 RepID=UPI0021C56D80|nr:C40 family peptidase [Arthrobacter sp. Marseille-P9274]